MDTFDTNTGFFIADTAITPVFSPSVSMKTIEKTASSLILSASGWRKVYAASADEESIEAQITDEDYIISGIMAATFIEYYFSTAKAEASASAQKRVFPGKILIGMDSRPTGPAIADSMVRICLASGLDVTHVYICAAPEIMAYSAYSSEAQAFIYISASHNPVGHNGVKFGYDGGVIGGREASDLIELFWEKIRNPAEVSRIIDLYKHTSKEAYDEVLGLIPQNKQQAEDFYRTAAILTMSGSQCICNQDSILSRIRSFADSQGLGIVAEFNGSARTLSIDYTFLREMGIQTKTYNDKPRQFSHRIVPEGHSLDQCKRYLQEAYSFDPTFVLGYVPDCDGDRGNIVYIDEKTGTANILEAQEVFALTVLSECAFMIYQNPLPEKRAIAVNGPTSLRIDEIAKVFNIEVFRAEVGEANVVNLADSLRGKGYEVRILGEGSNGGNITYPSKVRDPLNTLLSLIKLLALRDDSEKRGLFHLWCDYAELNNHYNESFSLIDIINSLPAFTTTSAYEPEALLHIKAASQGALKSTYEKIFLEEWSAREDYLCSEYGIHSWKEFNMEGIEAKEGMGSAYRSGKEKGGLKIQFYDSDESPIGFLWMRGSGTEPVFRILVDIRGNNKNFHDYLLHWHTEMVKRADFQSF